MNSIIMLNWYHFDLNKNIINLKLKNKNLKKNNFIDGEFEDIDDENDRKI